MANPLLRRRVGKKRLRAEALETAEIDLLVGDLNEHLAQDAPFDGSHVFGAFGHHEIMGAVELLGQVAQRAGRQHPVVLHGARGVDHHDVDLRLDVTVLEAVVHDDQIDLRDARPSGVGCPRLSVRRRPPPHRGISA